MSTTHEYMISCVNNSTSSRRLVGRTTEEKNHVERRPFRRSGTAESNFRHGRPNRFYAILLDPETNTVVGAEKPPVGSEYPLGRTESGYTRVYPLGKGSQERVWRNSYESCLPLIKNKKLASSKDGTIYQLIEPEERSTALFSNWTLSRYNAGTFGANLLGDIIGKHNPFPYPKSIHTIGDAIFAVGIDKGYYLDYFAGSGTTGHAVINLNREDGGRRKFILVEMGEYFDTVLLPRIKKVAYAPEWKDGRPNREATAEEAERGPRVVKYMRLESYEDALDNIEFGQAQTRLEKFDDYLVKYMLDLETRGAEHGSA